MNSVMLIITKKNHLEVLARVLLTDNSIVSFYSGDVFYILNYEYNIIIYF